MLLNKTCRLCVVCETLIVDRAELENVIIAAGLVFWLESAWPDLIVAAAIAVIFLHSAWEIIGDARRELREPK